MWKSETRRRVRLLRDRARTPKLLRNVHVNIILGLCLATVLAPGTQGGLADGLVAHWAFNDQSGSRVSDSSGNGFHGELYGGRWIKGQSFYDGATSFDGVDDKVVVPGADSAPPPLIGSLGVGSIAVRFRFNQTGSGDIIPLFYFGESTSGSPQNSLIIEIGHAQTLANRRLYYTIVNAGFCYDSGTNLLFDRWYQFVAVVRTNGNTGYLNGQEMTARHYNLGSDAGYTNFFSSVPVQELLSFAYGRGGTYDPFFYAPASISDVRIYDRPLEETEIQQLYAESDDPGMLSIQAQPLPGMSSLRLSWPGSPDYFYTIWQSAGLTSSDWTPMPGLTDLAGFPGLFQVVIPIESSPSRYFRLSVHR